MDALIFPLIVLGVLAVLGLVAWLNWRAEQQRSQDIAALATRLGLVFQAEMAAPPAACQGFKLFERGHTKRVRNILTNDNGELALTVADYRYTTGSGKHQHTHRQTICMVVHAQAALPRCLLRRQSAILDALGKWFGGQDIDFDDDPAFSRRFVLQGDDEARLRQVFGSGVRSWCLQQDQQLMIESQGPALLIHFGRRLEVERIADLIRSASTLMSHLLRPQPPALQGQ